MHFEKKTENWISPTICVTHRCNLNCIYCYESSKDNCHELTVKDGIEIIKKIFETTDKNIDGIEFCLIGGEPLLKFNLIKELVEYFETYDTDKKFVFSATTNGTILTEKMKRWFEKHKEKIILCLSLDGTKDTHNYNRCGSYELIDFDFFKNIYPSQGVKMTLSQYSLNNLYQNVVSIHELGFSRINGANLFEGNFNWENEQYLYILGRELKKILEFYLKNENQDYENRMFTLPIGNCEDKKRRYVKNCGIGGKGSAFYDVDGKKYPCVMCTKMTLSKEKLNGLKKVDFTIHEEFVDFTCNEACYLYPICSNCAGANYINYGEFSKRDKTKCDLKKLFAIFNAEFLARKIVRNPSKYTNLELKTNIIAIKKIRDLYYDDFSKYIN